MLASYSSSCKSVTSTISPELLFVAVVPSLRPYNRVPRLECMSWPPSALLTRATERYDLRNSFIVVLVLSMLRLIESLIVAAVLWASARLTCSCSCVRSKSSTTYRIPSSFSAFQSIFPRIPRFARNYAAAVSTWAECCEYAAIPFSTFSKCFFMVIKSWWRSSSLPGISMLSYVKKFYINLLKPPLISVTKDFRRAVYKSSTLYGSIADYCTFSLTSVRWLLASSISLMAFLTHDITFVFVAVTLYMPDKYGNLCLTTYTSQSWSKRTLSTPANGIISV